MPYTFGTRKVGPPRNEALMEAVVKQARTTWHSWLIACDANVCPEDFKKSLWFESRHMFIEAPGQGVSTRKGPNGELVERTYDHVIPSHSLQGKIKDMEVVDGFESRPDKAVTFLVERDKEFQLFREQHMPKALPGHSGVKLPGRNKVEEGRVEEEEKEKGRLLGKAAFVAQSTKAGRSFQ